MLSELQICDGLCAYAGEGTVRNKTLDANVQDQGTIQKALTLRWPLVLKPDLLSQAELPVVAEVAVEAEISEERTCVRACVRACVRLCVCVRALGNSNLDGQLTSLPNIFTVLLTWYCRWAAW